MTNEPKAKMLSEEQASRRLEILAGWLRGIRQGAFALDPARLLTMEKMLGEVTEDVRDLETIANAVGARRNILDGENILAFPAARPQVITRCFDPDAPNGGAA